MIIVINGAAGSGKTTFAELCCAQVAPFGLNVSTVDFVKHLATECGWDGTKTAANRKFLSDLKQLLVEWNDVPYHKTIEAIEQWERGMAVYGIDSPDTMVFVHCREPEEITKFVKRNNARTLRIIRPNVEGVAASNASDANVGNFVYDDVIVNNGSLDDLTKKAAAYVENFMEKTKK